MPRSTKSPSTDTKTPRTSTRTKQPRTAPATIVAISSNPSLSHDDIAARAYELFLVEGASHGRDVEHWLRAEHELRERVAFGSQ